MDKANLSKAAKLADTYKALISFRDGLIKAKAEASNPKNKPSGVVALMVGALGNAGRKLRVPLPGDIQERVSNAVMGTVNNEIKILEKEIEEL